MNGFKYVKKVFHSPSCFAWDRIESVNVKIMSYFMRLQKMGRLVNVKCSVLLLFKRVCYVGVCPFLTLLCVVSTHEEEGVKIEQSKVLRRSQEDTYEKH